MESPNILSPEEQTVTFVELFFDLIFVFSVTQVVGLLHHEFSWIGVGQAVLVFWLVWWAWTQFTWALNAADTTHAWVELGTLAATAVAFFMAVNLPGAFEGHPLQFAIPYIVVRVIGLGLYIWVTSADPAQQANVRTFALLSAGGLIAVLVGGLLGGTLLPVLWGLAIVLDIVAANVGGQADGWNIHPEHFSERHGLFVIIALGETLIVAAAAVSGSAWTGSKIVVAILAVAITCGMWWSYFPRAKPLLDQALESVRDKAQSMMARDVFSLIHFPMLVGVIGYAVAIEEVLAHPDDPLALAGRLALGVGLLLFVGGMAVALWRATGRLPMLRLVVAAATAMLIIVIGGLPPLVTLAIALLGVVIVAGLEQRSVPLREDQ